MTLRDFYDFVVDCGMTYINKLTKKKILNVLVYIQILPGLRNNVRIWYTLQDGKNREIKARFKNNEWRKVNEYLKK